jgi:predicted nuclease of restriction endonuclease-like (RecB) superfamily
MQIQQQFTEITSLIALAKAKAYQAVNRELVTLYWQVGEYVSNKVKANEWGKAVVKDLADFIQQSEPNVVGFSPQNIWRMKQFYETYQDYPKLATLWRELSWSHNGIIFPLKTNEEREFYLRLTLKEKYTVRELERQINASYYERTIISLNQNKKIATVSSVLPHQLLHHRRQPPLRIHLFFKQLIGPFPVLCRHF